MIDPAPILAALAAGFLGSAHCLGMCAGISGMVAVNASAKSLSRTLPLAIAYNLGRAVSYTALGALVALFGDTMVSALPALAGPVRLLGGVLIILVGLQVAFRWQLLAPVESAGLALWSRIAPAAGRLLPVTTIPRAIALGLLWGFIPCGLVYSMLLVAAASASVATGAATMLAFGIGTMPAMLMTGLGALSLASFAGRVRVFAGLLIVLLGLLTIGFPLTSLLGTDSGTMHHH